MINEQPAWTTIPSDEGSLLGLALPGAVKPLDLKGVYKPGFHGLIIPPVDGSEKTPRGWKIGGLKKSGELNYLIGAPLKGVSLYRLIRENALTSAHLELLLNGISTIEKGILPEGISGSFSSISALGTFFTDEGELLLLPREVQEGVLPLQRGESPLWEEALSHPILTGPENLLFGWAVLAYYFFAGELPFPLEGEEKVLPLIRGFFKPLQLKVPELNEELANLIHRGLKTPREITVEELSPLFSRLRREKALFENLDREALESRRETAQKQYKRENNRYAGKRFLRRKGTLTLIIAGIILLGGAVIYTVLSGILAPPITRGWDQAEVVSGFYRGINELDTELVDDCETDKAGKQRVDMVMSLYAISRVRMGYEHTNPYINAEEWVSTRPNLELEAGEQLYGIRSLSVKRLSEKTFQAEYEEWTSYYADDIDPQNMATPPEIRGELITEELDLVWKREAWMIGAIRRLKVEAIDSPR